MAEKEPSDERDVHAALNQPATDPDPTEWPDPYDKRPDPRDPTDPQGMDFGDAHTPTGARRTRTSPTSRSSRRELPESAACIHTTGRRADHGPQDTLGE